MHNTHAPRKRFGQHFLHDQNILRKIVHVIHLSREDHVVEIGPGQGALTRFLLDDVPHLDAVELDRDLVVYLREKYSSDQLSVHAGDALHFNFQQLQKNTKLRVVGNLPYNISTPLLFHLFSQIACIQDMHFMLQKEVVLRLTAQTGDDDYGRLSVMTQYFCHADYLFSVSANAFTPPPQVASAIVRLVPKNHHPLTPQAFQIFSDIVKEAFNYRRKKLSNSLGRLVNAERLTAIGIDSHARAENVSLADYIRIAHAISVD